MSQVAATNPVSHEANDPFLEAEEPAAGVALASGVGLFGGYADGSWTRTTTNVSEIIGAPRRARILVWQPGESRGGGAPGGPGTPPGMGNWAPVQLLGKARRGRSPGTNGPAGSASFSATGYTSVPGKAGLAGQPGGSGGGGGTSSAASIAVDLGESQAVITPGSILATGGMSGQAATVRAASWGAQSLAEPLVWRIGGPAQGPGCQQQSCQLGGTT